jgi:hypothetical protein
MDLRGGLEDIFLENVVKKIEDHNRNLLGIFNTMLDLYQ